MKHCLNIHRNRIGIEIEISKKNRNWIGSQTFHENHPKKKDVKCDLIFPP